MRMRVAAVLAFSGALAAALFACVDLFHSTDFETLHDAGGDAGDVAAPDAAPDGPKPLVDFCQWSPAEARANATRACAWLGACGGPLRESVLGSCMVHALYAYDCSFNPVMRPNGATRALWSCLIDVKSCAEVDACIYGGAPPTCAAVASGSFTKCAPAAAGEVLVECGNREAGPPRGVEPCAFTGRACATIDDSTSFCAGTAKTSCANGAACNGTSAVDCSIDAGALVDRGVDCAAFGAGTCAADDAGTVACAPLADAGACEGGAAVTCAGDGGTIATSCVGGRAIEIDCAKLGVPCDVSNGVPAYEVLLACDERADAGRCNVADTCTGGKLRSCARGLAFEADCASLGLGACESIGGGAVARCAPP